LQGIALPDSKLIAISSDDAFHLGALSSIVHCIWTLRIGSHLGVGNDPTYVVGSSFNKFPFPALEEGALKQRIRELGERLDAHRKRQQALHPDLTLTGLYNVLEKLRTLVVRASARDPEFVVRASARDPESPNGLKPELQTQNGLKPELPALTAKEREIHDQGLVSVLKQIHDDLDAAVLEAYGWTDLTTATTPPADLLAQGGPTAEALEQQLLTRLVTLNHERAAEEQRGHIRWLRPDYQAPGTATTASQQTQITLPGEDDDATTPDSAAPAALLDWPAELPAQVAAVRKLLPTTGPDPETLSASFGRKSQKRSDQITAILATLRALGLLA
jgi:hypothetical protein